MKYRKLRIAWSVAWGVVAVLLAVLCVRSYWWLDSVWRYTPTGGMRLDSLCGKIIFKVASVSGQVATVVVDTKSTKHMIPAGGDAYFGIKFYLGFLLRREANGFALFIPYWFLTLLAIAFAPLSWLRWRFGLRTLLIATTLVAVVLGLVVYASR
jgi:hypothetical protein